MIIKLEKEFVSVGEVSPVMCNEVGCDETATHIACASALIPDRNTLGVYCEAHAQTLSEDSHFGFSVSCPNCGCRFGVG